MDNINITLKENQKLFFSSDQHFGHKNVLNFCKRPFINVKEMNQALIDNWNSVIGHDDIVFVLGDMFWFHSRHEISKLIRKLNSKEIYIVPGNHCKRTAYELCDERVILLDDVSAIYLREEGKPQIIAEIIVSHCPLMTWPHRDQGAYNLFGHIHSGPMCQNKIDRDLPLWDKQYDVGVDNNNYTPISFEEIKKIIHK